MCLKILGRTMVKLFFAATLIVLLLTAGWKVFFTVNKTPRHGARMSGAMQMVGLGLGLNDRSLAYRIIRESGRCLLWRRLRWCIYPYCYWKLGRYGDSIYANSCVCDESAPQIVTEILKKCIVVPGRAQVHQDDSESISPLQFPTHDNVATVVQ